MKDTIPPHDPASDPRGLSLLQARLEALPGLLLRHGIAPPPPLSPRTHATRHFVIVGTGSSEAHGRYLEHLINLHTAASAEFVPLSGFLRDAPEARRGKTLVVFSQGLSPNAQTAFGRRREFEHCVVFTAATADGARRSGKLARAQLLEQLVNEGAEIVQFPLEDEYTTLIRLVGPCCAFVACWRFVAALGGGRLRAPSPASLRDAAEAAPPEKFATDFRSHADAFRRGFYLVASSPLSEFSQNLCYKFMESLFWSAPIVWDYLQFAHGPFQEVTLNPRPVVLIKGPGEADVELASRTERMLAHVGLQSLTLPVRSDGLEAIVELEMVFNRLVLRLIADLNIDQVNWPSKGRDDPLYGFFRQ